MVRRVCRIVGGSQASGGCGIKPGLMAKCLSKRRRLTGWPYPTGQPFNQEKVGQDAPDICRRKQRDDLPRILRQTTAGNLDKVQLALHYPTSDRNPASIGRSIRREVHQLNLLHHVLPQLFLAEPLGMIGQEGQETARRHFQVRRAGAKVLGGERYGAVVVKDCLGCHVQHSGQ